MRMYRSVWHSSAGKPLRLADTSAVINAEGGACAPPSDLYSVLYSLHATTEQRLELAADTLAEFSGRDFAAHDLRDFRADDAVVITEAARPQRSFRNRVVGERIGEGGVVLALGNR